MTLKTFTVGGSPDTIACITLFGRNRHPEVLEWHQRVMVGHFGLPVNYLECPFPAVSHGQMMNEVLARTVDTSEAPDVYWWLDVDCTPLRREAIPLAHAQVADKLTLWSHGWQSNHKTGPSGQIAHPYASQACLWHSRYLYDALLRPDMDHHIPRSDTAEEMTYRAKALGWNVSLLYPSWAVLRDTPLDNGMSYGMGNTYGPLERPLWHHTSSAPHPRHVEVFTETCKMVLAGAFEGNSPALPYAYKPLVGPA